MNKNETKQKIFEVKGVDFDAHAESKFMNTYELGGKLNSLLKGVFRDYSGCEIGSCSSNSPALIQQQFRQGELHFDIVLKYNPNGQGIPNLIARGETDVSGKGGAAAAVARLSSIVGSDSSRIYTVTEDTKAAVAELVGNIGSMNWNQRIVEVGSAYDNITNRQELLVKIIGIPLINLIELYYATEYVDDDGMKTKYEYTVAPVRQTAMQGSMLVQITKMDQRTVGELANSMGVYNNQASYISCF